MSRDFYQASAATLKWFDEQGITTEPPFDTPATFEEQADRLVAAHLPDVDGMAPDKQELLMGRHITQRSRELLLELASFWQWIIDKTLAQPHFEASQASEKELVELRQNQCNAQKASLLLERIENYRKHQARRKH